VARLVNKQFRHDKILQLIREEEVHTQEELVKGLRRLGVRATQVTLSRDLHELGVAKTPAGYRAIGEGPAAPEENHLHRAAVEFLRDVKRARNLVILKTAVGGAQPLALALDRENWPEVVGTLAGDDTILVIAATDRRAAAVAERLLEEIR
jgi:transcriptional regulator of arginine metabolism